MKKLVFLFVFSALSIQAFSQVKVSLRVSPAIATSRVTDANNTDGVGVSNNGAQLGFIIGPAADFYFTDNYAFSTGLYFETTSVGGKINNYDFKRNLQYLQTPITFKAFTNEIATNTSLYFQLGGTFNVKISEKLKSSSLQADPDADLKIISPVDLGLYIGAGLNYKVGESNALFAGLYYNRGLTNIISKNSYKNTLHMLTDLIGLEVGFTF